MKKAQILFAVFSAFLAVALYWISRPLPNFEDAWKYRLFSIAFVNGRKLKCDGQHLRIAKGESNVPFSKVDKETYRKYAAVSVSKVIKVRDDKLKSIKLTRLVALVRLVSWFGAWTRLDVERYLINNYSNIPNRQGPFVTVKQEIEGIPVNIYYPSSYVKKLIDSKEKLYPGIIFYHGGGFVYPSTGHEDVCIDYSMAVNAIVISVDYRLSPEHPCPAAPDDCYVLAKHILVNAKEYGLDSRRIILMGDSAGGNLAATTSLRLAKLDPQVNQPKFQILIVPGLQFFSLNLPSHLEDVNYPEFISTKFLAWFASMYLTGSANYVEVILSGNHTKHLRNTTFASYVGFTPLHNHSIMDNSTVESPVLPKAALKNLLNPFYFPLMAHNLTGVPPAYIITCEYDILKSDGELYASRLRKAAVPVIHKHYYGFHASHLFYNSSKLPLTYKSAIRMTEDLMNFLRENL